MKPQHAFLTAGLILAGCVGLSIPQTSNAADSQPGSSYASPGGEYTVKVPRLVKPGARMEEGTDPTNPFVVFADDFGKVYRIGFRDNQAGEVTFEQLESRVRVGESPIGPILEKKVVTTIRGQEIRFLALIKGGSPLRSETKVDGKTVESALDLVDAVSIFFHSNRMYTVSAGVTPWSPSQAEAASGRAKENLETFLAGLTLSDQPSIEVAASDDAEILEAVDAAVTVAKNHGFQYDASDSKNGRVVVNALWKDRPVTLTMRFFRKGSELYIASSLEQPADLSLKKRGQKIEKSFYRDLAKEEKRRGLVIYGDPQTPP